jgi:hypothetical protein
MFLPHRWGGKTAGPVGRAARESGQGLTAAAISGVVRADGRLVVFLPHPFLSVAYSQTKQFFFSGASHKTAQDSRMSAFDAAIARDNLPSANPDPTVRLVHGDTQENQDDERKGRFVPDR